MLSPSRDYFRTILTIKRKNKTSLKEYALSILMKKERETKIGSKEEKEVLKLIKGHRKLLEAIGRL